METVWCGTISDQTKWGTLTVDASRIHVRLGDAPPASFDTAESQFAFHPVVSLHPSIMPGVLGAAVVMSTRGAQLTIASERLLDAGRLEPSPMTAHDALLWVLPETFDRLVSAVDARRRLDLGGYRDLPPAPSAQGALIVLRGAQGKRYVAYVSIWSAGIFALIFLMADGIPPWLRIPAAAVIVTAMIVTARRVQREDPLGSIRIGAGGALEILEGDTVKATREDLVVTRVVWISRRVRVRSLRLSWPGRKPFVLAPAASGDWPGGGTLETTRQPDVIVSRLEWRKVLSALGIDDA